MAGRGWRTQWLMLLFSGAVAGAPPPPAAPPAAAGNPSVAVKTDTAELLLFLSEFEDTQGEWIDPADLPPTGTDMDEDDDEHR